MVLFLVETRKSIFISEWRAILKSLISIIRFGMLSKTIASDSILSVNIYISSIGGNYV